MIYCKLPIEGSTVAIESTSVGCMCGRGASDKPTASHGRCGDVATQIWIQA